MEHLGCTADEAVMVGDDVEADVGGALAAGLAGVLVKTGKYESGAESTIDPPPTAVVDSLPATVDWILERRRNSRPTIPFVTCVKARRRQSCMISVGTA